MRVKQQLRALQNTLILGLTLVSLAACQSMPSGPSSPVPSMPSLPAPPSAPSLPSPPSAPSKPSKPSKPSDSKSESNSDSKSKSESDSESTAIPPEWEQEGDESDGERDAEENEASFEEPELGKQGKEGEEGKQAEESKDGDGFDEPSFEDTGGLSQAELDALEKELDETLGDFDEQMEREQSYAEDRANQNTSEGDLGGIGEFENYNAEAEEEQGKGGQNQSPQSESEVSAQASSESESSASGASGPGQATRKDGKPGEQAKGEPNDDNKQPDIPDQSDDDIVARQLREAAENERDPELRKKLWEEYRKYNTQ
jgi:hypothetical protein